MPHSESPHGTAVLQIRGLRAGYDRHAVLSDLELEIHGGEWFALLGPNGSGKTTLLYCVVGMLEPLAGEVAVCGHRLRREPLEARRALGFACTPERLPGLLTGRQCLEVYAAAKGLDAIDAEVWALTEAFEMDALLGQYVDTYSLGTRQKLAALLALVGAPRLIVLDEAFNGLDPASALALKSHLLARIRGTGASVLLATHALDVVERYADRAALLLDGRIVHQWRAEQIAALRARGGLEADMAAVTRARRAG